MEWTRPMNDPLPPPTSAMRNFRFSGALIPMVFFCSGVEKTGDWGMPAKDVEGLSE